MEPYELWRLAMYGVGVFVTCNVGGLALAGITRRLRKISNKATFADADRRKPHPFDDLPFDEMARYSDMEDAGKRQTFDDIRRQVDGPEAVKEPQEA